MAKRTIYFFLSIAALFLLSGCIHRELIISGPSSSLPQAPEEGILQ